MLCQKCRKNPATVRYAEVVDGQVTEQRLCQQCMELQQSNEAPGFELTGVTTKTARPARRERPVRESAVSKRSCPACGALLSRILDDGRAGCSQCYSSFGEQIESVLEGLHLSLQHRGKVSQMEDNRERLRNELQNKRSLLRSMLKAERYEDAAGLRDEIKLLETGLFVSQSGAD